MNRSSDGKLIALPIDTAKLIDLVTQNQTSTLHGQSTRSIITQTPKTTEYNNIVKQKLHNIFDVKFSVIPIISKCLLITTTEKAHKRVTITQTDAFS